MLLLQMLLRFSSLFLGSLCLSSLMQCLLPMQTKQMLIQAEREARRQRHKALEAEKDISCATIVHHDVEMCVKYSVTSQALECS